jgi:hypothetical protein
MTTAEYQTERRHTYETRLAILEAAPTPTTAQHNLAVLEADMHIAALKRQERDDAISSLSDLKSSL